MLKEIVVTGLLLFLSSAGLLFSEKITSFDEFKNLYQENLKKKSELKRADIRKYKKERKKKYTDMLNKVRTLKDSDINTLTQGCLFVELKEYTEADERFDQLINKKSELSNEAEMGKVRVLIAKGKHDMAFELFRTLDQKHKVDDMYGELAVFFARRCKEVTSDYVKRVLSSPDISDYSGVKLAAYTTSAEFHKKNGEIDEAVKVLKQAQKELKNRNSINKIRLLLKKYNTFGKPAPEISAAYWFNTKKRDLQAFRGKVVVLDFFATWCIPCRYFIPSLNDLYEKYKAKGLEIICYTKLYGISYSDDKVSKRKVKPEEELKLMKQFIRKFKMKFPVAVAENSDAFRAYGVRGMPTVAVIDREGRLTAMSLNKSSLETVIKRLLEK